MVGRSCPRSGLLDLFYFYKFLQIEEEKKTWFVYMDYTITNCEYFFHFFLINCFWNWMILPHKMILLIPVLNHNLSPNTSQTFLINSHLVFWETNKQVDRQNSQTVDLERISFIQIFITFTPLVRGEWIFLSVHLRWRILNCVRSWSFC